jgi:hypothetical protein
VATSRAGWNSSPGTSPGVLIAAFTDVSRFLASRLASSFVVPVEDLYVMILAELGKGA